MHIFEAYSFYKIDKAFSLSYITRYLKTSYTPNCQSRNNWSLSPSDKDTSLIQNYVQGSGGNEHLSINSVMIFKEIVSPMCDCCADTEATRHFLAPPVLSDEKHNLHDSRKVSKLRPKKMFDPECSLYLHQQ